jgi:excisionase family DNA binding protein
MPGDLSALIPNPLISESLVSLQQVARAVGVGDRTIMRWVEEGHFPQPVRRGGSKRPRLRFRLEDVKRFLAEQGGEA